MKDRTDSWLIAWFGLCAIASLVLTGVLIWALIELVTWVTA